MKKMIAIAVALLLGGMCRAQDAAEVEKLFASYKRLSRSMAERLDNRDFESAERAANELLTLHIDGSGELKEAYEKNLLTSVYYNLTCLYALKGDPEAALEAFAQCVDGGYTGYYHAIEDRDLDGLRDLPRFISLMDRLRERGDFVHILRRSGEYVPEDREDLPVFRYEEPSTRALKLTREYFRLDTIVPGGSELERIVAILDFVNRTVPHDGTHRPPCEFTAMDIYNYSAANGGKGVNCRALAMMLNECYLAAGFRSMYVTCFPASEEDTECHVITAVWADTLRKFIWMDPSFNAYVTDGEGNFLGIGEVRRRMIEGLSLALNPDARWNGEPYGKESYLDRYMSKNLFWFSRPVQSCYNAESKRAGTQRSYVALIPGGYEREDTYGEYITSDSDYFWSGDR